MLQEADQLFIRFVHTILNLSIIIIVINDIFITGCYALAASEFDTAPLTMNDYLEENHVDCKDHCMLQENFYYAIQHIPGESTATCHCIRVPEGGTLPDSDCRLKECTAAQDPFIDFTCHQRDKFTRAWLYKSWDFSCDVKKLENKTVIVEDFQGKDIAIEVVKKSIEDYAVKFGKK